MDACGFIVFFWLWFYLCGNSMELLYLWKDFCRFLVGFMFFLHVLLFFFFFNICFLVVMFYFFLGSCPSSLVALLYMVLVLHMFFFGFVLFAGLASGSRKKLSSFLMACLC